MFYLVLPYFYQLLSPVAFSNPQQSTNTPDLAEGGRDAIASSEAGGNSITVYIVLEDDQIAESILLICL